MKLTEWIWATYKVSGAPILAHKIMHIMQNTSQVKGFLSCTSFSSTARMYTLMWLVFQFLECSYFN